MNRSLRHGQLSGVAAVMMALAVTAPVAAEVASASAPAAESWARTRIEELETRVAQLEQVLTALSRHLEGEGVAIATAFSGGAALAARARADQSQAITAAVPAASVAVPGAPPAPPVQTQPAVEGSVGGAIRGPYGGYMELHFNEDELGPGTLDFHRFVLLYEHQFSDKMRFYGEIEVEHGLVEGGEESGELEVEQAFLDFQILPTLSARGGMMMTPIGIINENHDPAAFHGVERPFVDTVVIPSTWFANGGGVAGRFGNGFTYKAYAMSTLNGAFFSAEEGFRDGRQKGFFDDASNLAAAVRLEYAGVRDLAVGTSYWTGNTGFEFPDISANATLFELDARYRIGRFDLRGQYVTTRLDDSVELNRALQRRTGINPNIAEEMLGYYLESAMHLRPRTAQIGLAAFYRYERFNTQERMAPGFLPLRQFNRDAHTVGLTLFPHPDVAVKVDYSFLDNESTIVDATDRWNLGIGWWF